MLSENRIGFPKVTLEEVNRLLDVGRLLLAILTPEELEGLQRLLNNPVKEGPYTVPLSCESRSEIGKTGVVFFALEQISPVWATYLRVSDEDKQTSERSFAMQRQRIQEQLLVPSSIPLGREYIDLLIQSG